MKISVMVAVLVGCLACGKEQKPAQNAAAVPPEGTCPTNTGITVPAGFCATIFADSLGHVRDIAIAPNGDVFVNTWSGKYYQTAPHAGGFLVGLRQTSQDGKASEIERFGTTPETGGTGGTGIVLYGGYLYAEEGPRIVRYKRAEGQLRSDSTPQTILTDMPITGDHPMHPFVIDSSGTLYVEMGSASNSCQINNRTTDSPGHKPCTELQTRAGLWKYDANKLNQRFSPAARYATGIRNAVGMALDGSGQLWVTQHGRDQLGDNFPKLYTLQQSAEQPAEELLKVVKGADYGWPNCYYDRNQQKLVLAPEYGGDGGKAVGVCASKTVPATSFPGHWAPDGLVFYTGTMFPSHYRGGAFLAFHGSWNRMVGPQEGYNVVFVPFTGGAPSGPYEVFADGFAGPIVQPDKALHRPVDVAVAPDGALFISDDQNGRVWRVTYKQ
ncbi:MAG TPA: PQQ-dependent sugar dehydrogenase [Gemmatimonadaceae bacterium]|jgi:glucose/arabinose dehydrogenase|nr:PQQ-dependent sugar dehydrogenase [Gemmatimonadaceae bacterium]